MSGNANNSSLLLPTYPNDKIVGAYKGSFDAANDTTQINYTLAGGAYSAWWYKIPHSFGQGVMCDLMTSTDGVSYTMSSSIAFSDSSFLYIYAGQGSKPSGTIYYKLVASWIDNFMGTVPFINKGTPNPGPQYVTPVLPNLTTAFDSRVNFRKIYASGIATIYSGNSQGPIITAPNTAGTTSLVKVYMECLQNQVWPCHSGGTNDLFLLDDSMATGYYYWSIGSTGGPSLHLQADSNASCWSNGAIAADGTEGTIRFWYKVLV